MPIKGLTDRPGTFPRLGTLRKGAPKPQNGRAPGKDLTYFRFDTDDAEVAKTFTAIYGAEPTAINVYLPFPEVDANLQAWREHWVAGGLVHRCDGETCVISRAPDGAYTQDPIPCPGKCSPVGRLAVIIPELQRLALVTVLTTSIHDIAELHANIEAAYTMRGNLSGIPFILRRAPRMISMADDSGKRIRREKWLLSIEPAPDWVALQIASMRQLAMPSPQGSPVVLIASPVPGVSVNPATGEVHDPDGILDADFTESSDRPPTAPSHPSDLSDPSNSPAIPAEAADRSALTAGPAEARRQTTPPQASAAAHAAPGDHPSPTLPGKTTPHPSNPPHSPNQPVARQPRPAGTVVAEFRQLADQLELTNDERGLLLRTHAGDYEAANTTLRARIAAPPAQPDPTPAEHSQPGQDDPSQGDPFNALTPAADDPTIQTVLASAQARRADGPDAAILRQIDEIYRQKARSISATNIATDSQYGLWCGLVSEAFGGKEEGAHSRSLITAYLANVDPEIITPRWRPAYALCAAWLDWIVATGPDGKALRPYEVNPKRIPDLRLLHRQALVAAGQSELPLDLAGPVNHGATGSHPSNSPNPPTDHPIHEPAQPVVTDVTASQPANPDGQVTEEETPFF